MSLQTMSLFFAKLFKIKLVCVPDNIILGKYYLGKEYDFSMSSPKCLKKFCLTRLPFIF